MSPKELYNELKSIGRMSIYGRFDGIPGIYTISDVNIYFHSSAERFRGAMPTLTEMSRYIDISNAVAKYPYSWILGLHAENDYRISVAIPDTNPMKKPSPRPEQENDVYIIRKRKYTIINQNY